MSNKNNKCCLNCTFCMRHKYYKPQNLIISPIGKKKEIPLSEQERVRAKNSDFLFIGEEHKEFETWCKKYDEAKNKCRLIRGSVYSYANSISTIGSKYNDYENYGIEKPPPFPPDNNYLFCWKEQWNENTSEELINERENLKKRVCQYYYPYAKKENKTLNACDAIRKENEGKRDFKRSSIVYPIIIGLITGIISGIIVYQFQVMSIKHNDLKQKKQATMLQNKQEKQLQKKEL